MAQSRRLKVSRTVLIVYESDADGNSLSRSTESGKRKSLFRLLRCYDWRVRRGNVSEQLMPLFKRELQSIAKTRIVRASKKIVF
jgi:hypothetical protein